MACFKRRTGPNNQTTVNAQSLSLTRHKRVTLLFLKYTSFRTQPPDPSACRAVARDIEDLGGPFVRAARMLSTRADLLSEPILDAFSAIDDGRFLGDEIEEESLEVIEQVIEDELGKKIPRAFASFHPKPTGFSGIGQIHHAVLHDGRHVHVRIQRPALRQKIVKDLDTLAEISGFIDDPSGQVPGNFSRLADRLRVSLLREIDYRLEEAALTEFREKLDGESRLRVPLVIHEFSSSRVLTTEFIDGSEIWEIPSSSVGRDLANQLIETYLDQMLAHGLVHPDPNQENLLITPEGDLVITEAPGCIRLNTATKLLVRHLLSGLCLRDAEAVAAAISRISKKDNPLNHQSAGPITEQLIASFSEPRISERFRSAARIASLHGLPLPPDILRIADLFANLADVSNALCPQFNFENVIATYLRTTVGGDSEKTIRFPSPSAA